MPRLFQWNLGWWNIIPFGQIYKKHGDWKKKTKSFLHKFNWKLSCSYFRRIKHVLARRRHHRWILVCDIYHAWCFWMWSKPWVETTMGPNPQGILNIFIKTWDHWRWGLFFLVGLVGFGWIVADVFFFLTTSVGVFAVVCLWICRARYRGVWWFSVAWKKCFGL